MLLVSPTYYGLFLVHSELYNIDNLKQEVNMCNLMETEIEILNKGNGIGNQVLYDLCKEYPLSEKNKDGIAAQMWLIGRSYAASPERRGYKHVKGTKIEYTASGNGLDDYFEMLADKFIDKLNEKENSYLDEYFSLLNNRYDFEDYEKDTDKLTKSIIAVLELNSLLKQARFEIDQKDLETHIENNLDNYDGKTKDQVMKDFEKNNKNMISFCSKFLHFHFPDTVFIIDGITESHFKGRTEYSFSFKSADESGNTSFENSKIKIAKKAVDETIDKLKLKGVEELKELTEPESKYVKHCVREYLVAAEINENCNNIFKDKYIPRVVDTYMLVANQSSNKTLINNNYSIQKGI